MEHIRKQANVARRRLTAERFFGYLPWTCCIALGVGLVGMFLPKLVPMTVDTTVWYVSWMVAPLVIALVTTLALTLTGRPSAADAAAEIDKRFALRERLSSALMLTPQDRETELGQALVVDANKRAETLDVRDKFQWGLSPKLLLPLVPALLTALFWLVPNREQPESLAQKNGTSITQVKNSMKPLLEQIKKKREDAEKQGLTAAVDMFKKLEGELAKLQKDTKLDTKQSLAKLNDIKDQLAERRKELGGAEALKKNLQNLEKFEAGPAEKLNDALKQGDFNKAEEALEQLLEKMSKGEMNASEMQKLEKQLEQLAKAMSEAAESHEQSKQALKEQIKQAEASGDMQKAAQLQRKLDQAQAQDANMAQMQQMADTLAKAQQSMRNGDSEGMQEALEQMASQLQEMNQSDSELQDLDELMDSLSQSKSQMMCKECKGQGCSSCMGSMPGQIPGMGMGEGRGQGERPEEETDADFFESQVRAKMQIGQTVTGGNVGGDNRKGTTQIDTQDAVLTSLAEEPEALDDTPLPKTQREHAREYFNSIREGKK
jgi:hypothetical protein